MYFSESDYLTSKLAQLNASGVTQYKTTAQVKAAIEAAGFTTQQHFEAFGADERTSPNQYFNANEYLAAKAAQLNKQGNVTTWTADTVAAAIKSAGMSVYSHFEKYGWDEGVNPSNSFSVSAYLATKATQSGLTVDAVKAALKAGNLSPVSHFMTYGVNETGVTVTPVPAAEQVTPSPVQVPGQTFTLTTGTDTLIGTSGNDTFTGTAATYAAADADQIIDSTTTDNDTYNLTLSGAATPKSINVENVNVTVSSTGAAAVTASSMSGVSNLTVTRTDVTVGGSTIVGNKTVDVQNVDASKVAKVTAGAGTVALTVVQAAAGKAGITIDGDTATGAVAVTGSATLNAANAASTVTFTALGNATEDAKAVTINAAKATTVTTAAGTTGAVTVNAAAATTVTVAGATGGATIVAKGDKGTLGTNGIIVSDIDDSGASITTSYVGTSTTKGVIAVEGTAGLSDAATVSAAGVQQLRSGNTTKIETLNLSGNGAAVTYEISGTNPADKYNLTGAQDVTLKGASTSFAGKTVTDATTAGTTTVNLTTVVASDLSKVAADKIVLAGDSNAGNLDFATGANISLAKDQTGLTIRGKAADATVNVAVADDTNADGTEIELTVGALNLATNVKVANIDATVGKLTATSTTLDTAAATAGTLNITGTKAVNLGTVDAKTINAANFTGALTMSSLNTKTVTEAQTMSVTSGSGNDSLTFDDTNVGSAAPFSYLGTKFTVDAGNGTNTVTITSAKEASSFTTGTGNDTINVNAAAAYVVVAGAGNDTVNIGADVDTDSILVGGEGTDKLVFKDINGEDLSNKANFSFTGFEEFNVALLAGNTITISAAQFNNQTFTLKGGIATDKLAIVGKADTDNVINASGVTVDTAVLSITGANKNDTLTGTASADIFVATAGTDVISGGDGNDTFDASSLGAGGTPINGTTIEVEGAGTGVQTGIVVNLSAAAIANTTIVAAGTGYTANTVTSVEAGKTAYLYGAAAATNSAVQQTLSSIENVTGTAGNDYIVGSTGANVISAGAGDDTIIGGAGADTMTGGAGNDKFAFASNSFTKGAANTAVGAATNWDLVDSIKDFVGNGALAGDSITLGTGAAAFGTGITFTAATTATVTAVTVAGGAVADVDAILLQIQTASAGTASTSAAAQIYDVTLTAAFGGATRLLIVNDNTATINNADAIINITGVTGALNAADFTFA